MKYLKQYESRSNWTYKYLRNRQEEETFIEDCIFNYCILNKIIEEYYYLDNFLFLNNKILVNATDTNSIHESYYIKDIDDFILYMNNPKEYQETKKYNI